MVDDGVPDRGDLVWLTFDPLAGHEQTGRRPALVLSPAAYNRLLGLAFVCPVTSRSKGYLGEVEIPEGHSISGFILSDQVRNLDWRARRADPIEKLESPTVELVLGVIRRLLE